MHDRLFVNQDPKASPNHLSQNAQALGLDLSSFQQCLDSGKHAARVYQRALAITEQALGPDRPDVAVTLDNYGNLLRATKRVGEADAMKARASGIRAKHAREDAP